MNTKFKILFLILIFCSQTVAVDYPSPTGYVNDFAKILPSDVKSRLEQKLSDYEKQTSIEIAVVTTPSLDGMDIDNWTIGLATKWGVGKKGKDNGLVIAVAPNERRIKIEVGYGLEEYLPDGKCGRILDEFAIPNFRNNNYPKGIEETVNAVVTELGTKTAEERAAEKAKLAEERKKAKEKAAESIKSFLFVLLLIVLAVALIALVWVAIKKIQHVFSEWQRKKQLRKEMQEELHKREELIESLPKRMSTAETSLLGFPDWARELAKKNIEDANSHIEDARNFLLALQASISGNVDEALSNLESVRDSLVRATACIIQVEKDIPAQIENYKKGAPSKVAEVEKGIVAAEKEVNKALSEGFKLNDLITSLASFKTKTEKLRRNLAEKNPNFRDVFNSAEKILSDVSETKSRLNSTLSAKMQNDKKLGVLPKEFSEIKREVAEHEKVLSQIKQNCPEANWKDISGAFANLPAILLAAEAFVSLARTKNSMEKQDFSGASKDISDAKAKLEIVRETIKNIADRDAKIKEAKKNYAKKLAEAETALVQSSNKVKDSDVGIGAKNKATEAGQKLNEAKETAKGSLINWLSIALLLASALTLSNEAKTKAQNDIDEAEEERRRRRKEEEARREAEERRRRASYSHSHSSTSYHGSSFSGFGGGHFGGGGASRGW